MPQYADYLIITEMKKTVNLILGIFLTIIIFGLGFLVSRIITLNSDFFPPLILTLLSELILSLLAIYIFTKNGTIKFRIQKVKLKYYINAFLITIPVVILINTFAIIIIKAFGFKIDPSGNGFAPTAGLSTLQIFLFIFIGASICEEMLFRGFTLNFFEPLKSIGIHFSKKIYISLPVLLSGLLFGLAHLVLLFGDSSGPIVFRTVLFATTLGMIAGYFQEKHQSILPAIVVHMTGNLPLLILSFLL